MSVVKESGSVEMRFGAALISAQMLATTAFAETLPDRAVSVLNNVCVTQTASEARMSAGEKMAAAENWKLVRSEPAPVPVMHNYNGTKLAFVSSWKLDGSQFFISILRPEMPGVKYDVCLFQPDVDIDADELANAIDRQFGSAVIEDKRSKSQRTWFFTEEKARGNCGRQILLLLNQGSDHGEPKTLIFTDFAYPNDRKWDVMAKANRCPNP